MTAPIYITYPSGAHGSLLRCLLSSMAGYIVDAPQRSVYDRVNCGSSPFVALHEANNRVPPGIQITVAPSSYLKYVAMCISRTKNADLVLEDFDNTIGCKLVDHPIMQYFLTDLDRISGGSITTSALRDWARLCFFANQGATVRDWMRISCQHTPRYDIDFEAFYDGSVIAWCQHVLTDLGFDADPAAAEPFMTHFRANNRYFSIDKPVQDMLQCIEAGKSVPVPALNWLQQGYIDQWLQQKYKVDPLAIDQYWTHTQDLYHSYSLGAAIK